GDRCESFGLRWERDSLRVGYGNQQRATNTGRRCCEPVRYQQCTQAVCSDNDILRGCLDGAIQGCDPLSADGMVPVALLDPKVTLVALLPAALPVFGSGVAYSGDQQDAGLVDGGHTWRGSQGGWSAFSMNRLRGSGL